MILDSFCVAAEMTVGKDKEVTVKSKGAGGQGKVAAKVTGPSGKPVACKVRVINKHLLFLLNFKVVNFLNWMFGASRWSRGLAQRPVS